MPETPSPSRIERSHEILLLSNADVLSVFCETDPSTLLALDVVLLPMGTELYIEWFDTTQRRALRVARIVENSLECFSFTRADQPSEPVYYLKALSLDDYNKRIKPFLVAPHEFSSEQALHEAFRKAHGRM